MSDPTTEPPPPKPPSKLWKWTKRIGCVLMLLVFTCCGLTCGGGWLIDNSLRNWNKDEVDRLHAEGIGDGDIEAMHRRADERFRKRYSLEDLQAFLRDRPGLLDRANLNGMDFARQNIDGAEFVMVKSKRSLLSFNEWDLVFRIVDGVYTLVGISPGLDEFVPSSIRFRGSSSRRHRHHH
jgi:hypothetical protein